MYKIVGILFFLCASLQVQSVQAQDSQQNNAALLKIIAQSKNTDQKAIAYNKLAYALVKQFPDSAFQYAQQALLLAEKSENDKQISQAYLNMAFAKAVKSEYSLLKSYADKAYNIAEMQQYDSLRAAIYLAYASYHYNNSEYDQAIQNALHSLQIFEARKNTLGMLKARVSMAQVYQLKNDLPRAEKILKEILEMPGIPTQEHITSLHTLANVYGMQGKYDSALTIDRLGLELTDKAGLRWAKSMFYDNMANCYLYSDQYELAEEYFLKSLKIDSSLGNKKQMSDSYLNLGILYSRQNKLAVAIKHFIRSIELSSTTGYREGTYQAYLHLSEAYQKDNQHENAIQSLKKGQRIKDSIINESSENKIAEMETLYETQKKEQQLTLQKSKIDQKNLQVWALLAAIGCIVAAGFSWYRKKQYQNKMALQDAVIKEQLQATRSILMAEEKQRSRIAAELHDGVGQLMSAAKMNLSSFETDLKFETDQQKSRFENLIKMVDEGCEEIRNVSHQMMPNAVSAKGLEYALHRFVKQIDKQVLKISLHTEGLDNNPGTEHDTVLYRVIQEAVNNVLKHAQAKRLDISIMKSDAGTEVSIEDDGVGFAHGSAESKDGLGLQNIRSRVKYLKGSIEIDSRPGKGTLIAIHIPK